MRPPKFNQSPSFRVPSDQPKSPGPAEKGGWNLGLLARELFWILALAAMLAAGFIKFYGHSLGPRAAHSGNHLSPAPQDQKPATGSANHTLFGRCPEPCDYSDIINPKKVQKVMEKIGAGRFEEIEGVLSAYLSPLAPHSKSPYKDEQIWVQNFNNMQKVFEPTYWQEIKALLSAIRERTRELNENGAEIKRLSEEGALEADSRKCQKSLGQQEGDWKAESDALAAQKTAMADLDKARAAKRDALEKQRSKIREAELSHSKKINDLEVKKNQVSAFLAQKQLKNQELERTKERLQAAEAEVGALHGDLAALNTTAKGLRTTRDSLAKDHEALLARNETLVSEIRIVKLRFTILSAKSNLVSQLKSMVDLDSSTERHFRDLLHKTNTTEGLQEFLESLNTTLSLEAIKKRVGEATKENSAILNDAYETYTKLQEMVAAFRDTQTQIQVLAVQLPKLEAQLKENIRAATLHSAQIEDNLQALRAIQERRTALEGRIKDKEGRRDALKKEVKEGSADFSPEQKQLREIEKERTKASAKHQVN